MEWTKREIDKLREFPPDLPWSDIQVPLFNSKLNPSKSEPAFEDWIDGIFAYHFDAANDDDWSLHLSLQIPHDWAEGTQLRPHMHWAPTTTNTGDVVWELDYIVANVNEAYPAAASTLTVTDTADGVANKHQIADFGLVSGDGLRISAVFACRLTRLGDDGADTFTGDAVGISVVFHYQRDSNGSYHEFFKLRDEYASQKGTPPEPFKLGAW